MRRNEHLRLALPQSARAIQRHMTAFQQQFDSPCYLFVRGSLLLASGEQVTAPHWLPVVRPEFELDLLGIGDPEFGDEDELLLWVGQTQHAELLLSTSPLTETL